MEFTLTLKNEKVKYYKTIRDLVVVLNFLSFIFLFTIARTNSQKIALVIGLSLCSFYLLFLVIEKFTRKKAYQNWLPNLFPLLALVWIVQPYWWISLLMLFFFLLDKLSSRRLAVLFKEQQIRFPAVPARIIEWTELNNVVLKDGLLTIDFKNNKLLQAALLDDLENPDENIFNDFCKRQLNK